MAKKILITFGILITIFMIASAIIDMNKRSNSIEKNKCETVAKVYKYYSNRSFSHYYYKYFYNGIKYKNYQDIDDGNREECVDKYYRINLSKENPQYSKIFLTEEIKDSLEIKQAGFD